MPRPTVDGVSLFGTVTSPDATGQNENTSQVPSGVTFNPAEPADTTIPAVVENQS